MRDSFSPNPRLGFEKKQVLVCMTTTRLRFSSACSAALRFSCNITATAGTTLPLSELQRSLARATAQLEAEVTSSLATPNAVESQQEALREHREENT